MRRGGPYGIFGFDRRNGSAVRHLSNVASVGGLFRKQNHAGVTVIG